MLVSCLQRNWGLAGARVIVHNGGMGSQTWFVDLGGHRWVAKAVAANAGEHLAGGMAVADRLEHACIRAGAAVPADDGRLVITSDGASLALLTWVPGEPLTGDSVAEQQLIGKTLAQVHEALAGFELASVQRFHWVDPTADYLGLRRWLRPAILEALADLDAVYPDRMVWGLLHAPRPMRSGGTAPAAGVASSTGVMRCAGRCCTTSHRL